MSRVAALLLVGLVLTPATPAAEVAPAPRAVNKLPVAPFPHPPGLGLALDSLPDGPGLELTREDPGIDVVLPNIDRIDRQSVEEAITPDRVGQPNVPGIDTTAPDILKLPPAGTGPRVAGNDDGVTKNLLPAPFSIGPWGSRSGATKTRLLKEGGGSEESERAVAMGLTWLARQQKADGGWEFDGSDKAERIAATGLALLPFLAAGETHLSGKKYQKTVAAGLGFLLKNCPPSGPNAGKLSSNMYAQAIGALALCEAYGMTKDRGLLLAGTQASINYIVKAQGTNGSWGYSAGSTGDTSIVGWQIQALHSARLGKDIVVPDQTIKKAVDFLNLAGGGSRKSMYGYNDNAGAAPGTSLTAVGLLSRYTIDGWGPEHAGMIDGVQGLMRRAPGGGARPVLDVYFYYYATQVVHFSGGEDWKTWNEGPKQADGTRKGGMRDWLVGLQTRKEGANQGSWDPDAGWIGRSCGRLGTTALSVLTLEVYYRHLPLYKRAAGEVIRVGAPDK